MTEQERLLALVDQFAGKRALVLGDMVADEYIFGAPLRISREAPVLVLRRRDSSVAPGGALNPAVNARTLGAEVYLAGVIGDDKPGRGSARSWRSWVCRWRGCSRSRAAHLDQDARAGGRHATRAAADRAH